MLRLNADGPAGLKNRWSPGPEPKLTTEHRKALAAWVERGPIPAIHGADTTLSVIASKAKQSMAAGTGPAISSARCKGGLPRHATALLAMTMEGKGEDRWLRRQWLFR